MQLRTTLISTTIALGAFTLAAASFRPAPAPSAAAEYSIDPVHSSVLFRIKHMGTSWFYGRVNDVAGKVSFDDANPAANSIEIEAKLDSLDTNNDKRNGHLKSPDFFNVAKFPTATFKSKTCSKPVDGMYEVAGDFTLHGVTKPLTIKVEKSGAGKGPGGDTIGFETVFTIKRSDFDMKYMPDALGDEVRMIVAFEAAKQGAEKPKDKPKEKAK